MVKGDGSETKKKAQKASKPSVDKARPEAKAGGKSADVKKDLAEIDDLFSNIKKRKNTTTDNEENDGERVERGKSKRPAADKKKKEKKKSAAHSSEGDDDSEDDPDVDPYFEFIDSDEEPQSNDNATYGLINNAYNPSKIVNPEAPLERIDPGSGLPVYKAHLLKVGEGGGTALCPFDCNCCF